jgi:hypothetical protein
MRPSPYRLGLAAYPEPMARLALTVAALLAAWRILRWYRQDIAPLEQ